MLLFRKAADDTSRTVQIHNKPHLMVVFLVGETPTGGVHQHALQFCLRLVEKCHNIMGARRTIRLIGPTFSGTADSLATAVRGRLQFDFKIISGSATGADRKRLENCVERWVSLFHGAQRPVRGGPSLDLP
jgi:hypothetical protein